MTTPCLGRRIAGAAFLVGAALVSATAGHAQCVRLLTGSDTDPDNRFGSSLDVSGDRAVIATSTHSPSSKAYVFDLLRSMEIAAYEAPQGAWEINSAAIGANVGLVGTPWEATYTLFHGSAHMFDPTTGQHLVTLLASPPAAGDFFGWDVALDGDHAVIGAPVDPMGGWPGSVFVFKVSTAEELFQIWPSDGSPLNGFGSAVDVAGDYFAVANPYDDDSGGYSGSVYVFDVTTGQELYKLTASDASPSALFGWSIAIDGLRLYVGAPHADPGGYQTGAVYVYDLLTGLELIQILASDYAQYDAFGTSVAARGGMLVVGAPGSDDQGPESGTAYVFDAASGQELFKVPDPASGAGDRFGASAAAGNGFVLLGCPQEQPDRAGFVAALWLSPAVTTPYCGPANYNSSGVSASISATVCGAVGWNDFRLDAQGMPPNKFGYFLVSDTKDFAPFQGGSQGNLCLGGNIGRFSGQVQSSGAGGAFGIEVDLQDLPVYQAVLPGETLHFQAWFRDANPHSTSNFTNGVSVTFF